MRHVKTSLRSGRKAGPGEPLAGPLGLPGIVILGSRDRAPTSENVRCLPAGETESAFENRSLRRASAGRIAPALGRAMPMSFPAWPDRRRF